MATKKTKKEAEPIVEQVVEEVVEQPVVEKAPKKETNKIGIVNVDQLNIREGASLTSAVVIVATKGGALTLTGKEKNGFYEVLIGDSKAYCMKEYVTV